MIDLIGKTRSVTVGLIALKGDSDLDDDVGDEESKGVPCKDGRHGVCC